MMPVTPSPTLNSLHYKECVEKRGLPIKWVLVNCRSVSALIASNYLSYRALSDGIWLQGYNSQGQFKPDKPWKSDSDKKAPKYRTPMGEYDAMLPNHPDDPYYWIDLIALKVKCYQINGHPCLLVTEGFIKALMGCSNDIPTVALLGVEMGLTPSSADPQGKRYLVETLSMLARAGFGFIHAMDADCATNPNVLAAQLKLVHQLKKFNVPQYSVTGLWTIEEGKGMDDYIQKHGADKFKQEVLAKAVAIEKWEKQFTSDLGSNKQGKPPKPAAIAAQLAEEYRLHLKWHDSEQAWYRYEALSPGIWSEESDIAVGAVILAELEARVGLTFGAEYVSNVCKLLKYKLIEKRWHERDDLIPLIDGVLRKDTLELLPHSPAYNLTWGLPIRWSERSVGCEPIKAWMLEIMKGDPVLVEVLRAVLNCVVFGRADYQRYLEAIGPGGTGKGTFFRLASALVGDSNVFPTTLKNLEENRFELAAAAKAKLIVITEAEKYGGEVNVLKALTGEDKTRIEVKGRQQKCGDGFTFKGFVLLSANEAVQNTDYTSGLERRRLSIPFIYQTSSCQRRNLNEEFKPYLPGLLEWVLTMPKEEVRGYVLNTKNTVASLAKARGEALCDTNPLADWLDNKIIHDPTAKTYVGVDDPNRQEKWLYANYASYSRAINARLIGQRRYTNLLEDLCCNQLKLEGVKRGRDRYGSYFEGLRFRQDYDLDPGPVTGLEPSAISSNVMGVTKNSSQSEESVTAETLDSDGCDGYDKSMAVDAIVTEKKNQEPSSIENTGGDIEETGASPVTEAETITARESQQLNDASPNPSQLITHLSPVTTPVIGQRVRVHCLGSIRDGFTGVVKHVKTDCSGARIAVVRLDDASLEPRLRNWENPLPGNQNMWLEVL